MGWLLGFPEWLWPFYLGIGVWFGVCGARALVAMQDDHPKDRGLLEGLAVAWFIASPLLWPLLVGAYAASSFVDRVFRVYVEGEDEDSI